MLKRFVICDDDFLFGDAVAAALRSLYGEDIRVRTLRSGAELRAFFAERCEAEVLLLDIELGEYSGIDLVRQYQPFDSTLQVIYISGYPSYCTDVYDTRHVSFLTKPIGAAQLKKAVDAAFAALAQMQTHGIPLTSNGKTTIVAPAQLLYVESRAHLLYVTTSETCLDTIGKLDVLLAQLGAQFVRCHQSFVINMARVKRLDCDGFLMENGVTIPISKQRRTTAKRQFMCYVGGRPWTQD